MRPPRKEKQNQPPNVATSLELLLLGFFGKPGIAKNKDSQLIRRDQNALEHRHTNCGFRTAVAGPGKIVRHRGKANDLRPYRRKKSNSAQPLI
jgi:hypothetical protein